MDPRTEMNLSIAVFVIVSVVIGVLSHYPTSRLWQGAILVGGSLFVGLVVTELLAKIHMMGSAVDGAFACVVAFVIATIIRVI
jgi:hypothetical protein